MTPGIKVISSFGSSLAFTVGVARVTRRFTPSFSMAATIRRWPSAIGVSVDFLGLVMEGPSALITAADSHFYLRLVVQVAHYDAEPLCLTGESVRLVHVSRHLVPMLQCLFRHESADAPNMVIFISLLLNPEFLSEHSDHVVPALDIDEVRRLALRIPGLIEARNSVAGSGGSMRTIVPCPRGLAIENFG